MRLNPAALAALSPEIERPTYDRDAQGIGIVHVGIGAFHRAHQAVYTDDAMNAGDRDWRILGVSLRSPDAAERLNPQKGLYTVIEQGDRDTKARVVGAVAGVIEGQRYPYALSAAIAVPGTHILSFTITEKGYARGPDGDLDAARPAIANDLAGGPPQTVYGYLEAGLRRRRAAGGGGLTLLSCDNLAGNGELFGRLLATFLAERDADLARWFGDTCTTPSTMVDRIVPATLAADRTAAKVRWGIDDAAIVTTEPFRQWAIEDRFAGPRPAWEAGGAQIVTNVEPFERAKLRMLNGTHSALAYLGLERGHTYVHQAMRDPMLRPVIEGVMREAAASLGATPIDRDAYAGAITARLDNAAIPYRLDQIARDGSQKIPARWLATLASPSEKGGYPNTIRALAAWIRYVRTVDETDDPMAGRLKALWQEAGERGVAEALFGNGGIFAGYWTTSAIQLSELNTAMSG